MMDMIKVAEESQDTYVVTKAFIHYRHFLEDMYELTLERWEQLHFFRQDSTVPQEMIQKINGVIPRDLLELMRGWENTIRKAFVIIEADMRDF